MDRAHFSCHHVPEESKREIHADDSILESYRVLFDAVEARG
jgi:hypothetical protein